MRDAALHRLAVGFFDGVHLGHQAILRGADAALTFRNHPLTVLEFTRELAEMEPAKFVETHVFATKGHKGAQRAVGVRCGANWRFGKGGAGDAAFLRALGVDVEVAPFVDYKGDKVSSTRIRACLERGEIADANAMMGRKFKVSGSRFQGKGLGGKMGYPTVNMKLEPLDLKLPCGVYEVDVGGMRGIANYGLAPTMEDRAWKTPVLEVHFPGKVAEDVRRETSDVFVELIRFVRPERKFDSVEDLQRQIAVDCATITA